MNDELKPCPFCGMDEPSWCDENGGDTHFVQCRSCFAEGERMASKEQAITMWNTRVPRQELAK